MSGDRLAEFVIVALCLAGGGLLKGATGAGAPILAVPALTAFFDVRFAVVVMLLPNFTTNAWQGFRFRRVLPERAFMIPLLAGGIVGVTAGTFALKELPSEALSLVVALAVLGYVALRLARPHWHIDAGLARALALPAGVAAGLLQGASGLSAPVSLTFLNAMALGRHSFIAAIAVFFATFTAIQIIAVAASGLIMPGEWLYSLFALLPVSLAMPIGSYLANRASAKTLDRVILAILSGIALKLIVEALF